MLKVLVGICLASDFRKGEQKKKLVGQEKGVEHKRVRFI
jgi:hypothetical protein